MVRRVAAGVVGCVLAVVGFAVVDVTVTTGATAGASAGTVVVDVGAQLRAVIDDAVGASASIPGMIVHVEAPGTHVDVSVAAGVADRTTGAPLTVDAGFRIASNTKTFTAATILRLVEQGELSLETPIAELLAPATVDVLRSGGYHPELITLRQLLVHTSGIYDYGTDPAYEAAVNADPAKQWTRLEQVRFAIEHGRPVGEPGAVYAYSDTGYALLGEIIERVTGGSLADAYRTLLDFAGLHLDATYVESLEPVPPGVAPRAHQYVGVLDGFDANPSFDGLGPSGLVSTVDDLATFYRALLRGEVFAQPETLDVMLEIPPSNAEARAGMGIFRLDVAGNVCWSHSGFWGTFVFTCPDIDVTVAATWDQAIPDDDFDPETVLQRVFQLVTET